MMLLGELSGAGRGESERIWKIRSKNWFRHLERIIMPSRQME